VVDRAQAILRAREVCYMPAQVRRVGAGRRDQRAGGLQASLLQRLHPRVPPVRLHSDLHWFPYAD